MACTLFYSTCDPNNDASIFLEITRVTYYEIIKLSLTRVLKFHGHEASKLDCFTAMHLWDAALHCRFRVLLRVNTLECFFRVISSCYSGTRLWLCLQPETLNLPNLFTGVVHTRSGICKGTLQIILIQGLCTRAPERGAARPLPPSTTTWPCRSTCVKTLRRATIRQNNNYAPQLNTLVIMYGSSLHVRRHLCILKAKF